MTRAGVRMGLAAALALATLPALAASGPPPPGASSCSGCHAVTAGSSVPAIHGRSAGEIAAAMAAFRSGGRPATVMNRIATGFTEAESLAIADWLAGQPAPR